jgi:hypothetical protein
MLRDEGIVVGETVVKDIVREWKRQRQEVFVRLEYRAGDLAESTSSRCSSTSMASGARRTCS